MASAFRSDRNTNALVAILGGPLWLSDKFPAEISSIHRDQSFYRPLTSFLLSVHVQAQSQPKWSLPVSEPDFQVIWRSGPSHRLLGTLPDIAVRAE